MIDALQGASMSELGTMLLVHVPVLHGAFCSTTGMSTWATAVAIPAAAAFTNLSALATAVTVLVVAFSIKRLIGFAAKGSNFIPE